MNENNEINPEQIQISTQGNNLMERTYEKKRRISK